MTVRSWIKVAISTGVYAFDSVAGVVPALRRGRRASGVVLLYHAVPEPQRARFAAQLEVIDRLGRVVHAADVCVPADGTWRVAITFDDALASFGHVATDELRARGWPCTVFVPSAQIGRLPSWDGADGYGERVLSAAELRDALACGAELGSHARTHARLPELDAVALRDEVAGSRDELAAELGQVPDHFAYPYGDWTDAVVDECRRAGFARTFTVSPEPVRDPSTYLVPRVTVDPTDSAWEFRLKLLGAYRWVGVWMRLKRRHSFAQASRKRVLPTR